MDRDATLPIIRAALGLPQVSSPFPDLTKRLPASVKPSIQRSVILEAEMVAYSERTHTIDGEPFCTPIRIFGSSLDLCRVLEDTWPHPIHRKGRSTANVQATATPTVDTISTRVEL